VFSCDLENVEKRSKNRIPRKPRIFLHALFGPMAFSETTDTNAMGLHGMFDFRVAWQF
jgi:hypothetical protein